MIKLKELLEDINQYKIYIDMDGVLTNFDKSFMILSNGIPPNEYENKYGSKEFWNKIDAEGINYWTEMEWMPNAKKLWQFIRPYNPNVLSAPSKNPLCIKGKRIWCTNELKMSTNVIIDKNKQKYATPSSILIDDLSKNINAWKAAGGIGILHTSPEKTISILKNILN